MATAMGDDRLGHGGHVAIDRSDYDDLLRRTEDIGIVCPLGVESLDEALLDAYSDATNSNITTSTSISNSRVDTTSLRIALQAVHFEFSDQARLSEDLNILLMKNKTLKWLNQKFSLLCQLRILRAKETYNSTLVMLRLMYMEPHVDLSNSKEIETVINSMLAEVDRYEAQRAALRAEIEVLDGAKKLKALRCQLAPGAQLHASRITELGRTYYRSSSDKEHDAAVKTLNNIQGDIDACERCIELLKDESAYYEGEQEKCSEELQFATTLAMLGGPINFFLWPAKIRNIIYKNMLPSGQVLHVTKFTPFESEYRWDKGTYELVVNPLFRVSRQFRNESASIYYSSNIFTCRNILSLKQDLGLQILPRNFRDSLETLDLTWVSLGKSTVNAVKALKSLRHLKTLNVYISWGQVLGFDRSTRAGVAQFKSLLRRQSADGKQINVFQVPLKNVERYFVNAVSHDPRMVNIKDFAEMIWRRQIPEASHVKLDSSRCPEFKRYEILINSMIAERLQGPILEPNDSWHGDQIISTLAAKYGPDVSKEPKLMTEAEVDGRLGEVLESIEAREKTEAGLSIQLADSFTVKTTKPFYASES